MKDDNLTTWCFRSREDMIVVAESLLHCHPHHFNVRPDWNFSLTDLNTMAVECIRKVVPNA